MRLSISRSIIEAHQGQVCATRNDGGGTTFSFSLPLDGARAP
jgi:signal transduction histidine kinase